MAEKIDGWQLHHLRFADDIVFTTSNISQAERMLGDFDTACGKIGLPLNFTKTMFMRNGLVLYALFTLSETNISECSSYVCLEWEINMLNDLAAELMGQETSGLGSFQEHRGGSEEDKEHSIPCPSFRINGTSCPNVCVKNLVAV
uniref:Reverse transcriptase domain-containing protein n=1 Tax=Angiostrongylus cantonensis TaxID=6313 RepID=A0A0K0DCT7_ANGCA